MVRSKPLSGQLTIVVDAHLPKTTDYNSQSSWNGREGRESAGSSTDPVTSDTLDSTHLNHQTSGRLEEIVSRAQWFGFSALILVQQEYRTTVPVAADGLLCLAGLALSPRVVKQDLLNQLGVMSLFSQLIECPAVRPSGPVLGGRGEGFIGKNLEGNIIMRDGGLFRFWETSL
ncbi:unnamed protein product [Calypogeia fissa]